MSDEQHDDDEHRCKHMVSADHGTRQCRNIATQGNYCGYHYDHPDRRIERTNVSLFDYVQSAMRALGTIVEDEQEKAADRVRAANSILDRTGHVPGQAITLQGADASLDEKLNELLNARATESTTDDDPDAGTTTG